MAHAVAQEEAATQPRVVGIRGYKWHGRYTPNADLAAAEHSSQVAVGKSTWKLQAKTYGLQICRVCGHIVRAAQGSQSREGACITVSDKGYTR